MFVRVSANVSNVANFSQVSSANLKHARSEDLAIFCKKTKVVKKSNFSLF